MIYRTLIDSEIERAVYIDPTNIAARAAMLARMANFEDERDAGIEAAEAERDSAVADSGALSADLAVEEEVSRRLGGEVEDLKGELETALGRIAALTSVTGLV